MDSTKNLSRQQSSFKWLKMGVLLMTDESVCVTAVMAAKHRGRRAFQSGRAYWCRMKSSDAHSLLLLHKLAALLASLLDTLSSCHIRHMVDPGKISRWQQTKTNRLCIWRFTLKGCYQFGYVDYFSWSQMICLTNKTFLNMTPS